MQLDDVDDLPPEFSGGTLKLNENFAYNESSPKAQKVKGNDGHNEDDQVSSSKDDESNNIWKQDRKGGALKLANPPIPLGNTNDYFTFRQNIIDDAINECNKIVLIPELDGIASSSFLLTQISNWDVDKERLILLTGKTLVIIKYDFIAMKMLNYKKIPLDTIESIVIGDLIYPSGSLVPYLNGIADSLSMLQSCLFDREKRDFSHYYQPRNRNMYGIQLNWNKGKMERLSQWNPLNDDLPFCTFTAHPLFFSKDEIPDSKQGIYDLDEFIDTIRVTVTSLNKKEPCLVHSKNIVLESYLGLTSLIHNRNLLGFFKVRGKFSF